MALTHKKLQDIAFIPDTLGAVFANPGSTKTFISSILLHNTSDDTAQVVKLSLVPADTGSVGTADTVNQFLSVLLEPSETLDYVFDKEPLILEDENDTLQAVTDDADTVTFLPRGAQDA